MKQINNFIFLFIISLFSCEQSIDNERPNIILIMTDDQGWGQTGYYDHPVLQTPNLDAMAKNGLRFDRFYAGAPVCSPTRASVLTGRTNDRTGVLDHGYALRKQEKTISVALKNEGYATGHFGKWHLNGLRGPGVPVLKEDSHSPGEFGFDHWLTVTNFFDIDPLMSENGSFIDLKGNSSDIIVGKALEFIKEKSNQNLPFFAVIWDGSPHDPFVASEKDRSNFKSLNENSQHHYGELVAFDRSLGVLRKTLKDLGLENNTILWYCSDNGGLRNILPSTVGGLRGSKTTIWEGGLRVPAVIEWPQVIKPRITHYPASTMDIFPTIADILDLPETDLLKPVDGISLKPIFKNDIKNRDKKIPFRYKDQGALVDNNFKLVATSIQKKEFELYDLENDSGETTNLAAQNPMIFNQMKKDFLKWGKSIDSSLDGIDYPEGKVLKNPERHFWMNDERYEPYLEEWLNRPEYRDRILRSR
ncbi:MAG: sulfatase [Flavobacteriaceae bacterium]